MKRILNVVLVAAIGLLGYNCEDAPVLDQSPADYISFATDETTVPVELNGSGSYDLKVYATYKDNSARSFSVTVDESSSASTASYSIPNVVEIPAGSNEGTMALTFLDSEISNSGETLVLNLNSNGSTDVGAPITINLVRNCPSNLEGNYVYSNGNGKAVTITRTGDKTYTVSGDNAFTTDYAFNIQDICNELTVTGGVIADNFGLAVSGNGTVDADTGNITIFYTVENNLTDREMIMVKQ